MTDAPAAVRILPMDSKKEFRDWSIEELTVIGLPGFVCVDKRWKTPHLSRYVARILWYSKRAVFGAEVSHVCNHRILRKHRCGCEVEFIPGFDQCDEVVEDGEYGKPVGSVGVEHLREVNSQPIEIRC